MKSTKKILGPVFFNRPALTVARELLGKFIVRKIGRKELALMITETEAYFGFEDEGSHAFRGRTPRNAPMWEEGGHIYVYFTYGMHWMLNFVSGKKDFPAGVLIRGAGNISGPARLTKALSVDKELSGKRLGKENGLWVEDRGIKISPREIKKTPRIGIPNRGVWTHKPWRFVLTEGATGRRRS